MPNPFHLAIPVHDLDQARGFYGEVIGCEEGRSSDHWIDFNLFGHQLVCHLSEFAAAKSDSNPVDGHDVPIPHFGVVLSLEDWAKFRDRLIKYNIKFDIEPHIRFEGLAGEQATMFFRDPSGNALEFKAFKDIERELFKT
jgi:hypothetical protein